MAFKDSANFGRHVSSKHIKAEEYQCNRCGRPFARRDAALRHMKTLCRVDAPGPGGGGGGGAVVVGAAAAAGGRRKSSAAAGRAEERERDGADG